MEGCWETMGALLWAAAVEAEREAGAFTVDTVPPGDVTKLVLAERVVWRAVWLV
jgi:hypothetical protein